MSTDLTEYARMTRAFTIFDSYGDERADVSAEHDQAAPNHRRPQPGGAPTWA